MLCTPPHHSAVQVFSLEFSRRGGGGGGENKSCLSCKQHNGGAECGSLRVSTVRGPLLIVYSASQRKVLNESSSRRLPCSLMRPFMTFLIDLICLSQKPQKLLADAGFLIQSMLSLRSYVLISWSSISSIAFLSCASAPMKFVPLSQRISLTDPRLQMKRPVHLLTNPFPKNPPPLCVLLCSLSK